MTRIMCSASNCINYINNRCIAVTIKVAGIESKICRETSCNTYKSINLESTLKSICNIDFMVILLQSINYKKDTNHEIVCDCESCTYNFARVCTSTDIYL